MLHIVHPYSFKISENRIMVGPSKVYKERDSKISSFIREVIQENAPVLVHRMRETDASRYFMNQLALMGDPLYNFLFEQKTIHTLTGGIPIPDEKPLNLTEEEWEVINANVISHSQLKEIVEGSKHSVFIGGVLECCVANAMAYFNAHYLGGKLSYIPECCVSLDSKYFKIQTEPRLQKRGIYPVSPKKALELLKSG